MTTLRTAWQRTTLPSLSVLRAEALSGLVVALALIPNAISFSIIAGVDPSVGLYASFTMAVALAFLGGRPAMISSATAAMALVVAPLGREYGVDYLLAATILAGAVQVVLGLLGVARLMRFVPASVMTGFVNALAIMIFTAQIPHFAGDGWTVYAMIAAGLAIILLLPRLTTAVPAPLVAIIVLSAFAWIVGLDVPTVGDMGELPDSLPVPFLPDVPLSWETLRVIAPTAMTLALVGLIESLITAKLVDDYTETHSDKAREARGQGWANILSGFLGGMPGCATVGPTVMNVRSGARTRLSTFLAGVFLIVLVVMLDSLVAGIPMAALVAVMVFVAATTMDWRSVRPYTLRRMPWTETLVMVVTTAVIVATHNLALGVGIGVVTSMVIFARHAAVVAEVTSVLDPEGGTRVYSVHGELFFGSRDHVLHHFDYREAGVHTVTIDLSGAHVWDASAVAALDQALERFRRNGVTAEITGLNASSAALHNNVSGLLADAA
ncbi:SulP family inorganic anion transporter [Nocardiopsis gilva YIM 90087]|uniref:SulP family inorganic anion transporter n=1 Tax=Nocardiopsis gilva YIM 90087 TaxID=1235441 RepID=A0A223SCY0_9ACTN|nr:SulP family inorganic anion transporter [Nocardiopsis gilva]ASU85962.1 SulP family inorganic anion transporter [Nocardiopsis gilva YIM 90087]